MKTRKTEQLHHGRHSSPGSIYFLTLCTVDRRTGLEKEATRTALLEGIEAAEPDVENISAVIMPDHLHWLFQLGHRLSLGRVVARFKSQSRGFLQTLNLSWQRDFFDRGKRESESLEAYGLYIFLNPYRAGLVSSEERYPGYRVWKPDWFRFHDALQDSKVPIDLWMRQMDQVDIPFEG